MDYFINQTIRFDSINGLLNLIGNDNSVVQLSRPGSRLLTELITHSGNTLTREELLRTVWEEHGLRPSGSNLSNHISLLRKVFSQLGMNQNIIITVPKQGFRFDAEVTLISPSSGSSKATDRNSKNEKNNLPAIQLKSSHGRDTFKKNLIICLTIVITLLVIYFSLTTYVSHSKTPGTININSCHIIDLDSDSDRNREVKLKLLTSLIKEKHINCKSNNSTVYFRFSNLFPIKDYDQSSVFFATCRKNKKNRLTHCESFISTTIKKP